MDDCRYKGLIRLWRKNQFGLFNHPISVARHLPNAGRRNRVIAVKGAPVMVNFAAVKPQIGEHYADRATVRDESERPAPLALVKGFINKGAHSRQHVGFSV